MGTKRKVAVLLLIGAGSALGLVCFLRSGMAASLSQPESPSCNSFGIQRFQERKSAPDFSLKNLNGERVNLSEFKGKPVLITFWATWCASCREEIPALEKFSAANKGQFVLLLIAIDGERKGTVQKIVSQNKITIPVLLLLKEKVMDEYGVRGWIPLTFLVDPEGRLAGKIVGQRDWDTPEARSCLKELFELR